MYKEDITIYEFMQNKNMFNFNIIQNKYFLDKY